jgi:putative phosphonate metabolism protein
MDCRYAIYFVPPPESTLYQFGASILGYDSYRGEGLAFPDGVPAGWAETVREPQAYGFHATLKAPFRLADGYRESDLLDAFSASLSRQTIAQGGPLAVRPIGSFVAIVPSAPYDAVCRLAATCVHKFDRFRAPLTDNERMRRLQSPLTPPQRAHLEQWGYPYVFDTFQFHMTLTGPLRAEQRAQTLAFLADAFARLPGDAHRLCIDRIALLRQDGNGQRFRMLAEATLSDETASRCIIS